VKTLDARGRKAICEVLMMTKAVAKLIQAEQSHQIPTQMQMGRDLGMSLLDQSLLTAIAAREIDPDDAYVYAMDKKPFQKYVTDTSMLPKVDLTGPNPAPKPTSPASA
jgi:twitching motility protein PilT